MKNVTGWIDLRVLVNGSQSVLRVAAHMQMNRR